VPPKLEGKNSWSFLCKEGATPKVGAQKPSIGTKL